MLEMKKADGSQALMPSILKHSPKRIFISIAALALIVLMNGFITPAFAQQETAETDTTSTDVNINIPFYVNDFHGLSPELNSAHFNAFGDLTVQEALIRIPGIQVDRDGNINLRGAGFDAYGVSLNGFRLANTGMGNRSFDLASISTDAVSAIEVQKVVDPSMDAEALGGYINLKTDRLSAGTRSLNIVAGGGVNTAYINRGGPSSRGSIHYFEQFSDKISLDVNLNYLQEQLTREELVLAYGAADFGNGPVDLINQVAPSMMNDNSQRLSASTTAKFTPNDSDEYFFRLFVNSQYRERVKHQNNYLANGDWVDQFTTGAQGELGSYSHEGRHQKMDMNQLALYAGGSNELESMKLSYDAGWTRGRTKNTDYLFPFMLGELNFEVDMSDRMYPQFTITNRQQQILENGTVDRQFMMGQNFDRLNEDHLNDEYSARVDVNVPVNIGEIQAGASVRYSVKEGEFDDYSFEFYRSNNLRMINFLMLKEPIRNIDVVNDKYFIPWFLNTDYAIEFLDDQRPLFEADPTQHAYNSGIYNYDNTEQVLAAYVMGDVDFGVLQVKAGLRVEQTQGDFDGNRVLFDSNGDYAGTDIVSESADDFQLFPNVQFLLSPMEQNRVHLAYSRTIKRPNYYQQTPFERIDSLNINMFSGNAGLTPEIADNFDLMVEQKVGQTGLISVAGFYKSFSDIIVEETETISSGALNGYQNRTFKNSDNSASIFGAEFSVSQKLTFLPGVFNNLGIFGNYTWSQSNYETERGDETDIPGHSPHVVNAALNYSIGRLFAQVNYHWSAELLTELQDVQQLAPSAASGPVYRDRYEDGYQDISATVNFQLSERFRFWAHLSNLLPSDKIEYAYDADYYPTSRYVRNGLEVRAGIRYDL